jgi:thioredoxin-dependent peroxiredoxin
VGGALFLPSRRHSRCTIEACGFRDSFRKIEKTGAVVLGVSPDQPKAQKKFEEKYDLPFTLVADADKTICNAYGVIQEKNMYGKKVMGVARTTFIIGSNGKIRHIFRKVKPEGHADEVLEYLKEAQKSVA